jgi:hypothetical protein
MLAGDTLRFGFGLGALGSFLLLGDRCHDGLLGRVKLAMLINRAQ